MCDINKIKKAKSNEEFEFVCKQCGKTFTKTKKYISKNRYKLPVFCCNECQKTWYSEECYIEVKCSECGKSFKILKGDYNKSETKHFFCSHSCAATYNNKLRAKSDIIWETPHKGYNICPKCGKKKYYKSELCFECRNKEKRMVENRTLGSFIEGKKYSTRACTEIRRNARRIMEESDVEKVCAYCHNHEFDQILQVHHIKGILEFDKNATISEINSKDNLVWLCPNHHKMLENGLITLEK